MQFKKVYIVGGKIVMAKTEIKGRKKKRIIIFVSMALVIVTLITTIGVYGYVNTASNYTVKEHTERISKLAKKRYIDSGKFTGYKVYPLYNEKEEQEFFMVELEPHGFVYIKVYNSHYGCFTGTSMYMKDREDSEIGNPWMRYNYGESHNDFIWETDINGNDIKYVDSHFKVGGVTNEKKYLLKMYYDEKHYRGLVPAVKRGGNYLNLISMKEFNYNNPNETDKQPILIFCGSFIYKPNYN